jgi:hypothetical protein
MGATARHTTVGEPVKPLGLRTAIYPAPDLEAGKQFFRELLGIDPYFDEPFFVGFQVGGYELALNPAADPAEGVITYWGVPDAQAAVDELLAKGALHHGGVDDVGDGIKVATVTIPGGGIFGVIENPHFEVVPVPTDGPGR